MNKSAGQKLLESLRQRQSPIAVVGLGYVGLPLAVCLARHFSVIGFDVDGQRLARLRNGEDDTGELDAEVLRGSRIVFSDDAKVLRQAGFIVVAVPSPIDSAKQPDFASLAAASRTVGANLSAGSVVVFESTVYPGATEEICVPILEQASGLKAGSDFFFGYSPERINPADPERTVDKIRKIVSAGDAATLEVVAEVYELAIAAGVHRAPSVKAAEAAKLIENTQRDLNIALVNEFALICHRLQLDTTTVLELAGSKWNFLPFRPGLVGGQCIGVSPYHLIHKAEELGYHAQVILAGRRVNDGMGRYVAQECIRLMLQTERRVKAGRVLILGLTFKENCSDVRNTRVVDIIAELRRFGIEPVVVDPVADAQLARREHGVTLLPLQPLPQCDAIIAAVDHRDFHALATADLLAAAGTNAPFLDVKCAWDAGALARAGFTVWRL